MDTDINDNINQKLQIVIKEFKKRALAYYLHFETSELKLAQEVKNAIKEKYGDEKFFPSMNWYKIIGEVLQNSEELDNEINAFLKSQNYDKESFLLPKDRLKNMLWNDARVEGKLILSKFNS